MSAENDAYRHVVRKGLSLKNSGSINPKKRKRVTAPPSPPAVISIPTEYDDEEDVDDDLERSQEGAEHKSSRGGEAAEKEEQSPLNQSDDDEDALVNKVMKLDGMTSAEKTFHLARLRRQRERVEKRTALTHRERMARLNEHLSKLSEHFDIPKVGPG